MKKLPLLFFACAIIGTLAPSLNAQIQIRPTDELFNLACENIGVNPADIHKQRFSFWLDASKAVLHDPLAENNRRNLNGMYAISTTGFVEYFNEHFLNRSAPSFLLKELNVLASDAGVTAQQKPVFILQMKGTSLASGPIEFEKSAAGPAYNSFKVWNASKNPISIRSANIAYFAAFLRVILALEFQLTESQPGSRTKSEPVKG